MDPRPRRRPRTYGACRTALLLGLYTVDAAVTAYHTLCPDGALRVTAALRARHAAAGSPPLQPAPNTLPVDIMRRIPVDPGAYRRWQAVWADLQRNGTDPTGIAGRQLAAEVCDSGGPLTALPPGFRFPPQTPGGLRFVPWATTMRRRVGVGCPFSVELAASHRSFRLTGQFSDEGADADQLGPFERNSVGHQPSSA